MATMPHRAMTRFVCRIFIKATPQAIWDAICPAPKQSGGVSPTASGAGPTAAPADDHAPSPRYLPDLITAGEILEADPPAWLVRAVDAAGRNSSARTGLLSFELRDTLTGYTALTVSCEPAGAPGVPDCGTVGARDWDRLLGDLKAVLEADGRKRQPTGLTRPSPRGPLRVRPKLVPQAQALSGSGYLQIDLRERCLGARCGCLGARWRCRTNANRGRRRANANPQPASAPSPATVTAMAAIGGLVFAVSARVLATSRCRRSVD